MLESLANDSDEGMTAVELARETGLDRVTIHRFLAVFKAHGLVRQTKPRGRYNLGFRLVELADRALTEPDLVRVARPILKRLSDEVGETSHLAVLDGVEAVYLEKVEPSQSVRLVSRVGSRVPLYCTALGKAILASLESEELGLLLDLISIEPRTPSTVTSISSLQDQLRGVEQRGFALDLGENETRVHCVACAIEAPALGQAPAALSVSGPGERLPEERLTIVGELVIQAAMDVAAALRS